jgi:hypothetical protein
MHTGKKIRHIAHKTLLTFLGPAELDQHNDPMRRLDREYEQVVGSAPQKPHKVYAKKRSFERIPQSV